MGSCSEMVERELLNESRLVMKKKWDRLYVRHGWVTWTRQVYVQRVLKGPILQVGAFKGKPRTFFLIKFFGSGIVYPTGGCYSVPLCAVNSPARSLSVLKYRGTVIQGGWIQGAKGVCRVRIQVHCASGPCHPPQVVGGGQVLLSSR